MSPATVRPVPPLAGVDDLLAGLAAARAAGNRVDAFLFAAGLWQLVEDRRHPDPLTLRRAAAYLGDGPALGARPAGRAAGRLATALVATDPSARPLARAAGTFRRLAAQLAAGIYGVPSPPAEPDPAVAPAVRRALRAAVLRPPAGLTSFDQHPDDVRWLVAEYLRRHPDRGIPALVLGVRSSGSYLAPLAAAALHAAGVGAVDVGSYRPGRPFRADERRALAAVARAGGRVLVIDDPPVTGGSFAAAAVAATVAGVPRRAVTLLVPLFAGADDAPGPLRGWDRVVQPFAAWSIHDRLAAPERVDDLLADGWRTVARSALPPPPTGRRTHLRARYAVDRIDARGERSERRDILLEGAGYGYLGALAPAAGRVLAGRLPRVYGLVDGVLYRDYVAAPARPADPVNPGELADRIVDYVAGRATALPTADLSHALRGRRPAWEVAAERLAGPFGPLAPVARLALLEPLVRRMSRGRYAAVLDGKTAARHWLPDPARGGRLVKVDFHQRGFGHLDLACYDPVCDLAGAAVPPAPPGLAGELRRRYAARLGEPVDPERWLLYRLAELWRLGEAGDVEPAEAARAAATVVNEYLGELLLGGLAARGAGPLCAIDLDGVLETDRFGFPASSPAGAIAIRALHAHGLSPVVVSGRSLDDVRDRCRIFRLAGGVAEYGSVCYAAATGTVVDLRPAAGRALLDRAREQLAPVPGIDLDPHARHSIRARYRGGPVPADLLRASGPAVGSLRVVTGEGQTDLVVPDVDKGTGLRALRGLLSAPEYRLAVGDSAADLPMLAAARIARAPGNADAAVRAAGVTTTAGCYQRGLAEACGVVVGHRPGGCRVCAVPRLSPRSRALLAILAVPEGGARWLPWAAGRVAVHVVASRTWPHPPAGSGGGADTDRVGPVPGRRSVTRR